MNRARPALWLAFGVGLVFGILGVQSPPRRLEAQDRITLQSLQNQVNTLSAQVAALQSSALTIAAADARYRALSSPVSWSDLSGIPAGFADGTDDGLTSIAVGHGLVGNGSGGDPLRLAGVYSGDFFFDGNLGVDGNLSLPGNSLSTFGVIKVGMGAGPPFPAGAANVGSLYYNSVFRQFFYSNGTEWRPINQ